MGLKPNVFMKRTFAFELGSRPDIGDTDGKGRFGREAMFAMSIVDVDDGTIGLGDLSWYLALRRSSFAISTSKIENGQKFPLIFANHLFIFK